MERYKFCFENGECSVHEVFDKFDFYRLLDQLDYFIKLYRWDYVTGEWKEVDK